MFGRLLIAAAIVVAGTTIALAGNATLKHTSGAKVKINCNSSGCYVRQYDAAGKKGKRERVGPGGSSNFNKHVKAWNSKGYI